MTCRVAKKVVPPPCALCTNATHTQTAMQAGHYKWHFEGCDMQVLAAVAKKATQFRHPYDWSNCTNLPSFWLVKEGGVFYLMDSHATREGFMPHVARPIEEQDVSKQLSDDYVVNLPIDRNRLDDLITGKCGLFVSIGPSCVEYARYFGRPK